MARRNSAVAASSEEDKESIAVPGQRRWQWSGLLQQHRLIGLVLFVLALGSGLYRLGNPSIWFDEAFSVELARLPLPQLWHIIFGLEPNMELYYLFLHFWLGLTALAGLHPTEVVVRLPSVIFAALSSMVVFAIGLRFLDLIGAVVGATLYLSNGLQLLYAQQTRSYSLQLLLTCLGWYALLVILSVMPQDKTRRWWLCYIGATVLAIYAQLFSVLIVMAQCATVLLLLVLPTLWRAQARKQIRAFVVSLCIVGVLCIPMWLVSLQGARTGWLPAPDLHAVLYLLYLMTGYSKGYAVVLVGYCALGVLLVVLLALFGHASGRYGWARAASVANHVGDWSRARATIPIAIALFCWCTLPLVVSYIVSLGSTRLFSSRYLVVIVPPVMLLAGLCLCLWRMNWRWQVMQYVLALFILVMALRAVPYYYRSAQVEDWNSAVHWVEQHYQSGDGLVCYDNTFSGSVQQGCQIAVQYYLDAYPGPAHFTPDTPGAFSWTTYSTPDPQAAVNPAALSAYGAKHPRLILIIGRVLNAAGDQRVQNALQWLRTHDHFVGQFTSRTVRVYIFATHQ
jgi:mannosyltransferase